MYVLILSLHRVVSFHRKRHHHRRRRRRAPIVYIKLNSVILFVSQSCAVQPIATRTGHWSRVFMFATESNREYKFKQNYYFGLFTFHCAATNTGDDDDDDGDDDDDVNDNGKHVSQRSC